MHFSYGAEPVLRGVDLRVPRGATVAVVGATGSGKSTVIKLLTRLYERDRGVDQARRRRHPRHPARPSSAAGSPSSRRTCILFAGTLADNIALGKPYDRARLDEAVHRVGLDRALVRRGADVDAPRSPSAASNFSAGERQLVAFARALLRDPEILILDEATAHVDPEAEELIERGVHELMKGRTTLVIAHRLSTIRNADLIVVMDKGQIVEQGTHDELVAKGGLYAALEKTFRRQIARSTVCQIPVSAVSAGLVRCDRVAVRTTVDESPWRMAPSSPTPRTGEVVINQAARAMLGIPPDAPVDTTYLKDVVGFYPFDLAAGAPDGQPVREEVRIGERVLHSVVTPLRENGGVGRRDRRAPRSRRHRRHRAPARASSRRSCLTSCARR